MPDFTKLLAIGLLNYADDHGYFWANPLMIRGALFPFDEDSSKVRRALAQLVEEGYLRIGKAPDGREGGHIIKFSNHQRVDRPADSDIQPLLSFDDDSTMIRGLFDDQSSLDRKGREGIGKDISVEASPLRVPEATVEEIYAAYPRKQGKQDALKAIRKALASRPTLNQTLLNTVQIYANATLAWPESDKQFIPHPASWFNKGHYDDDPETWKRHAKPNPHQRANDRSYSQVDDYSAYKPRPDQLEAGA